MNLPTWIPLNSYDPGGNHMGVNHRIRIGLFDQVETTVALHRQRAVGDKPMFLFS